MFFLDTETVGLHGLVALIQYARDDGEIVLYEPWRVRVGKTLSLIERVCNEGVILFNAVFDWFHLSKLYTTWSLLPRDAVPVSLPVEQIAQAEERARFSDICLKPRHVLDLMLYAFKGPYQELMDRKDVRVRRVPVQMAHKLCDELERRIEFDGALFQKRADPTAPQWTVCKHENRDGLDDPAFRDVKLSFYPEGSLKSLAQNLLGETDVFKFKDVMPENMPIDKGRGFAPFALAWGCPEDWQGTWPEVAHSHVEFWRTNAEARRYAWRDVDWTRRIFNHPKFSEAQFDDDDSVLACAIAGVRWRGFDIDVARMSRQRGEAVSRMTEVPTAPKDAAAYLCEVMSPAERIVIQKRKTGKVVLEEIGGTWDEDDQIWMNYWTKEDGSEHPAAARARAILASRRAGKEVELYDKMLRAGRFHPSFNVMIKSGRMSGSDDFNPQGVISAKHVRQCFLIPDKNEVLVGGDFEQFEIAIFAEVYHDDGLLRDLQADKKIHAIFATCLYPHLSYKQVMASKGSKVKDFYVDGKRGVFGKSYGGDWSTLVNRLGIKEQHARDSETRWDTLYPGCRKKRDAVFEEHRCLSQPDGIGTAVFWQEPKTESESLLGFKRYFTLEYKVCKALFDLSQHPPKHWRYVQGTVRRRERDQTPMGATQSALYGAAFGLQGVIQRASLNHRSQSTGAGVTKRLQRRLSDLQPIGVHPFQIRTFNCHDEVMAVIDPALRDDVADVVSTTVEHFRSVIRLIKMDWEVDLDSWKSSTRTCPKCKQTKGLKAFDDSEVCRECEIEKSSVRPMEKCIG